MKKKTQLDRLTGLPFLNSVYPRIQEELCIRKEIGYIFFDLVDFNELQEKYGIEVCNKLIRNLGKTMAQQRGKLYREDDLVAVGSQSPTRFILFLFSPPRRKLRFATNDLKLITSRILQKMQNIIREKGTRLGISDQIYFHSGFAVVIPDSSLEVDKVIYEAHKEATLRAHLEKVMVNLISNISHELRTPLTCIKGYAETLLEGAMSDEELCRKFLKIINDEAHRLERLINDLLDLSMIDARQVQMRCKESDLVKVLNEIVSVIHPYARKSNITIKAELPGEIPLINADEDRLRQVLINLIDNAIKYSHSGGVVTVRMTTDRKEVAISVIDEGFGIPETEKDRIFERFYRVDQGISEKSGGRGLGLAIAKYIVEAHGGSISVESCLGKGSTFMITMPLDELWNKDEEY
ncbi:MAG: ATP-binding protein [Candidatus Eremiobacteraeota bacterium]|nr:ATP-binding protein [Candidatus Eremiobacteraeota bacterium]